jgi:hypothetical protein
MIVMDIYKTYQGGNYNDVKNNQANKATSNGAVEFIYQISRKLRANKKGFRILRKPFSSTQSGNRTRTTFKVTGF